MTTLYLPRRALFLATPILLTSLIIGFVHIARAQNTGRITGIVVNDTKDAEAASVAKLDVNLLQMGGSSPMSKTVQTDASGQFAFEGLSTDTQAPYFVRMDYRGVDYFSDFLQPASGQTTMPITLTVYETTTVPADWHITRTHLIMDVVTGTLEVAEFVQADNPGDRVFLAPLPLPEGAEQVGFDNPLDQFRVTRDAEGRWLYPIAPPQAQILLGYSLAFTPPNYTLALKVSHPIDNVSVLVADVNNVKMSSTQLRLADPFKAPGGQQYLRLRGSNLTAGTLVNISISNLPTQPQTAAPAQPSNSTLITSVILGLGVVAVLALIAYPIIRRGSRARTPARPSASRAKPQDPRAELIQAIADLDDAHDAGKIADEDYQRQRAALKAELIELIKSEK
jgi:hypothetical protein